MELHPLIEKTLWKMDFIEKYRPLVNSYRVQSKGDEFDKAHLDIARILRVAEETGLSLKYVKSEHYFKSSKFKVSDYVLDMSLILKYDRADGVWNVCKGKECLEGRPICLFTTDLTQGEYGLSFPLYASYDDLDVIVKKEVELFLDFKEAFRECICEEE